MATMNISLPDELRAVAETRVRSGLYANVSDYVRALIRQDQENQDKKARLMAILDKAEGEIAAGEFLELGAGDDIASYFRAVRKRGKKKKAAAE
ncbi:MAG: type II toxin-antitoxin system ParD family antitoxin [Amphiplicatus sp.]